MSEKRRYQRLSERVAVDGYELIDPLDYKLLEILPDEGSMFAGLYPLGETAVSMQKKLPAIDTRLIANRLRVLHLQKLVLKQKGAGTGGASIWQRTTTGKEVYNEWVTKTS